MNIISPILVDETSLDLSADILFLKYDFPHNKTLFCQKIYKRDSINRS